MADHGQAHAFGDGKPAYHQELMVSRFSDQSQFCLFNFIVGQTKLQGDGLRYMNTHIKAGILFNFDNGA